VSVRAAILLAADIVAVRDRDTEAAEAAISVHERALRRHVSLFAVLVAGVARVRGGGGESEGGKGEQEDGVFHIDYLAVFCGLVNG